LPREMIKKSFKVCGLNTQLGGSEDQEILAVKNLGLSAKLQERRINDSPMDIEDDVASSDSDGSVIVCSVRDSDTETDGE